MLVKANGGIFMKKKKKSIPLKTKLAIIACAACIAAVIATIGIISAIRMSVPENPAGTIGNSSGNLYNRGLFCENDGKVYFANPYDGYALYSMNTDETEIKKLTSTAVSSINADSKHLYYYQGGASEEATSGLGTLVSTTTGVYRAQKDGAKYPTCLDRVLGKYVVLVGNDIYYTASDDIISLKKVTTKGKDKETLLETDILPVCVQNSTLYYINNTDNLRLMAFDLRTRTSRQVLTEEIYMPIVEGNVVYGIDIHNNYSLVSINLTDKTKTLLDSTRTDMLNLTDYYIYYQTVGDNPQLKRMRRDGSGIEVVADGTYNSINSTSQYVYFSAFGSPTPLYKTPSMGAPRVTTFDAALQAAVSENLKKK